MAGSRGLEPQHSQFSLHSSADQLRHSFPHGYPACTALSDDFQSVSVVEQKRGGTSGCEGRNGDSNCSVSNVSISLNASFCEMQNSPFRLEPYLRLLKRKRVCLTVLFGCLVHAVLTNSRSNRSSVSPCLCCSIKWLKVVQNYLKDTKPHFLTLQNTSWAMGSQKVSLHTSWQWMKKEARSQQVRLMKNREDTHRMLQ